MSTVKKVFKVMGSKVKIRQNSTTPEPLNEYEPKLTQTLYLGDKLIRFSSLKRWVQR